MIKINLLPWREREKKENLQRQITIIAGSFILFFLVLAFLQLLLSSSIGDIEKDIKNQEASLASLEKIVGDIKGFKTDKEELEKKLDIIKTLEENRLAPVRMLDELTTLVPTKKIWLENFSAKEKNLRIEGIARDNIAVARFMKNIELSHYIKSVDLLVSKQKEVSDVKLQQFTLECSLK